MNARHYFILGWALLAIMIACKPDPDLITIIKQHAGSTGVVAHAAGIVNQQTLMR